MKERIDNNDIKPQFPSVSYVSLKFDPQVRVDSYWNLTS